jgi:chorismate mutase
MKQVNYYLIDASVLPEVYTKVIRVKNLLKSGEASSVSEAVKIAGISRSAYYKYKDKIFEYAVENDETVTIDARLRDNAGVLSSVMNELYLAGANVLSVNQTMPVNGSANVSVTVNTTECTLTNEKIIEKIKKISGVIRADLL